LRPRSQRATTPLPVSLPVVRFFVNMRRHSLSPCFIRLFLMRRPPALIAYVAGGLIPLAAYNWYQVAVWFRSLDQLRLSKSTLRRGNGNADE
jgi:hypothetical protein